MILSNKLHFKLLSIVIIMCSFNVDTAKTHSQHKVIATFNLNIKSPYDTSIVGLYQSQQYKYWYIRIRRNADNIYLKQLWNGREIRFNQKSDVDIYSPDRNFPLTFLRNVSGKITGFIAFRKDQWDKIKEPKPNKQIQLDTKTLKSFEGYYKNEKNWAISVFAQNDHIILTILGSNVEKHLYPKSKLDFFSKDDIANYKFEKNKNGEIYKVISEEDNWTKIDDPEEYFNSLNANQK